MRWLALLLLVPATPSIAAPDPKPATWADWTGDYKGPVRWTGCTVTGSAAPTLALEFVDGVASIDLDLRQRSFTHFSLSPADAKLAYFVRNRKFVLRPVATVVITAGNTIAHFQVATAPANAVSPAAKITVVCNTLSRYR